MATKKAAGTSKNGRDSNPKYLGVKVNPGAYAGEGAVLVRQRGTNIVPGENVGLGNDHTLFALKGGIVHRGTKRFTHFDGTKKNKTVFHVR